MACRRWRNAAARSFLKVPIKSRVRHAARKEAPDERTNRGFSLRQVVQEFGGDVGRTSGVPNCKQNSGCLH